MAKNMYDYDGLLVRRVLKSEIEDFLGYDYADRSGEIAKKIDEMTPGEYMDFLDTIVSDILCDDDLCEHFDNSILYSVREYLKL